VGKSHLAHAIAFEALKRGQSVYLGSAHRVLADLHAARADGTFARRLTRLCTVDLLVLDLCRSRDYPDLGRATSANSADHVGIIPA